MIKLLACDCGSSEQRIRQALHGYKYKNWAMEPIIKGKSKCLAEVEVMIRERQDDDSLHALFSHINNSGKWCVILGINDTCTRWSDIARGDMKSDVDAELIVENFS